MLDLEGPAGLFFPFDLTATGFALQRVAVCAGTELITALPRYAVEGTLPLAILGTILVLAYDVLSTV